MAGALLCYEAGARLQEFRGALDAARSLYRAGRARADSAAAGGGGAGGARAASRFLREWAAFEKRAGALEVRRRIRVHFRVGARNVALPARVGRFREARQRAGGTLQGQGLF